MYHRRLQDGLTPIYTSQLFNAKNTQYNLRNNDFELPTFETVRCGRHSVKYLEPLIWSNLPGKLKTYKSLNYFKRNMRKVDLSGLVN